MKKILLIVLVIVFSGLAAGFVWWQGRQEKEVVSPYVEDISIQEEEKPLAKYAFENLKKRTAQSSQIKIEKTLPEPTPTDDEGQGQGYKSYLFSYTSEGRKITGLANVPADSANESNLPNLANSAESSASANEEGEEASSSAKSPPPPFPVIIMIRGYVDQPDYEPGIGTKRAGEYFASHGFITLAPDFLGFAGSDKPPDNVWEERFLRPVSVIDLIASVKELQNSPLTEPALSVVERFRADPAKIGIWGHSNGGLVALTVLELTGGKYPTTLWAPVSQSFPYDILYYTYEFEDKGKALRSALSWFEKDYDVNLYSFDNYVEWIKATVQIHQGTGDEYIPILWTNSLVDRLKKYKIDTVYYKYPSADHNLNGAWDRVINRDVIFFQNYL